jgi:hypothetical protein
LVVQLEPMEAFSGRVWGTRRAVDPQMFVAAILVGVFKAGVDSGLWLNHLYRGVRCVPV